MRAHFQLRFICRYMGLYVCLLLSLLVAPAYGETDQIQPNDKLQIVVVGYPDYNQIVTVRLDGTISYFGGNLTVVGQQNVDQLVRAHLQKLGQIKDPVVMVAPIPQEDEFFVSGAVKTPGRYPIKLETEIDLYRAIALGGGTLPSADLEAVQLMHQGQVTIHNLVDKSYRYLVVNKGDLVYVPLLKETEVQGEVQTPGKIFFRDRIRLDQALAKAGGPNHERADFTTLVIIRHEGPAEMVPTSESFWLDLSGKSEQLYLYNGDVLYVPNAFKIEPVYVLGSVNQPGPQQVRTIDGVAQISVTQAIAMAGGRERTATRKKILVHRRDGTTELLDLREHDVSEILLSPGDAVEIPARFEVNWSLILSFISMATLVISLLNRP